MKSLKARNHNLAVVKEQVQFLSDSVSETQPAFESKLIQSGLFPFKARSIDTLQINVGKMCNQVCKHCHVDAGPDRKEIMTRETMQHCLDAIDKAGIKIVDLTGGAPEMNPDFRWFVEEITKRGAHVMVRCNLTIIVANKKYFDLPDFFKKHKVEVVSSLPHFSARRTDAQRGEGVFEKSIKALKMLNEVGYGMEGSGLKLNLVYNPTGAFMPADQTGLELEFKRKLKDGWNIEFNSLYAITNIPISRYLEYLVASENYDGYMQKLIDSYNPQAAEGVMCRDMISVGWDGYLYDCDFNQMLEMEVATSKTHISEFDAEVLLNREIKVNQHCYGCTAGAGSSCGGTVS
ncbi:MAG: arsenosugar biosynthesis radical SAM protein ArsS [Bacteroidetes bacterium]|nr:arsenosugar biosynthesis radical SAM protein ArsS [Bacteroidota bacterium]